MVGSVLGRHVGDGGAVGQRKGREPRPEVLDEAGHHPVRAQLLGHGEHQVGGSRALLQGTGELHPDHLRQKHVIGLPEQDRLRLDAADPPAHHPQTVDHGGVRVGAHQRVGAGDPDVAVLAALHHRREVLQVDLVHDARAGRHHAEVAEGVLRPPQQRVTLPVALHLALDVPAVRRVRPEVVHLHGVVDDEVGGNHRVDALRVAPHGRDPGPHGRQVHHGGHAREVLQHHPGGQEGHVRAGVGRAPRSHGAHFLLAHVAPAGVPEGVLEQDADREGKAVEGGEALFLEGLEPIEGGVALAQVQGGKRAEGVGGR